MAGPFTYDAGPIEITEFATDGPTTCLDCGTELSGTPLYLKYRICPGCRFHYHISASDRIELLADAGTFKETHRALVPIDHLSFKDDIPYNERLARAQVSTGLVEAVVTGTAHIDGLPAALAVLEFGFLNGSMGSAVGEKITLAAELALKNRQPFVLVVCGGGPRIQEGILSLMQMAKTVAAVKRLARQGLPFISILASPTTGHLYAGAASMADIIFAEPGALIGFAPLKTAQKATKSALPKHFHKAEFHLERGMIDRIVDRQDLKQQLAVLLDQLNFKYRLQLTTGIKNPEAAQSATPAWDRVQKARHQSRPTSRDYIQRMLSGFIELHGDRVYGDDPSIISGLGYLSGEAIILIAQERTPQSQSSAIDHGSIYPEGFRKAERMMRLAAKFKLPVITLIDTLGAYPGLEAEERGVSSAIAGAMSAMSDLPTPALAVIIGQGGSEAALALSIADRTLMLENAICSPVSPEAAAWLLYHDHDKAEELASSLKLTAHDCHSLGIIDAVIEEPDGGAHANFDETARRVKQVLINTLLDVQMTFNQTLLRRRFQKFRRIGTYGTFFQTAVASELVRLQRSLAKSFRNLRTRLRGQSNQDEDPDLGASIPS